MRAPYQLSFLLPAQLAFSVPVGRHHPCLHQCILTVGLNGLVSIEAPSKERAFEQATRFLRKIAKGHAPMSITAVLATSEPRGRDGWSIIVGTDVAFSPTSLPPYLADKLQTNDPDEKPRVTMKATA